MRNVNLNKNRVENSPKPHTQVVRTNVSLRAIRVYDKLYFFIQLPRPEGRGLK